jgi:hypothetical protein
MGSRTVKLGNKRSIVEMENFQAIQFLHIEWYKCETSEKNRQ